MFDDPLPERVAATREERLAKGREAQRRYQARKRERIAALEAQSSGDVVELIQAAVALLKLAQKRLAS